MKSKKEKSLFFEGSMYQLTEEEKAQLSTIKTVELSEEGKRRMEQFSLTFFRVLKGVFFLLLIGYILLRVGEDRSDKLMEEKPTEKLSEEMYNLEKSQLRQEREQLEKLKNQIDHAL